MKEGLEDPYAIMQEAQVGGNPEGQEAPVMEVAVFEEPASDPAEVAAIEAAQGKIDAEEAARLEKILVQRMDYADKIEGMGGGIDAMRAEAEEFNKRFASVEAARAKATEKVFEEYQETVQDKVSADLLARKRSGEQFDYATDFEFDEYMGAQMKEANTEDDERALAKAEGRARTLTPEEMKVEEAVARERTYQEKTAAFKVESDLKRMQDNRIAEAQRIERMRNPNAETTLATQRMIAQREANWEAQTRRNKGEDIDGDAVLKERAMDTSPAAMEKRAEERRDRIANETISRRRNGGTDTYESVEKEFEAQGK